MPKPRDHSNATEILRRKLRRRQRIALLGLAGIPVLAGAADGDPPYPFYYCTEDADTIAMLESGSSASKIFFTNLDTASRGREVAGKRACFPAPYSKGVIGDNPRVIFHLAYSLSALVSEGGGNSLDFEIHRYGSTSQPSSVAYALTGTASFGSDYGNMRGSAGVTAGSGVVEFAAGEWSKIITVDILDDMEVEEDETIAIALSSPTTTTGYWATAGHNEATDRTSRILDDELYENLIPPNYACSRQSVAYMLEHGSSIAGLYWSNSEPLPDGTGVYCWTGVPPPGAWPTIITTNSNDIVITPQITGIDPGDASATIHFTGGERSHTATCTPTGGGTPVSATSSHSPITLTGLTNGVVYSCVVSVTGTLTVSSAALVTPTAAAPPGPSDPRPVFVFAPWVLALLSSLVGLFGILYGAARAMPECKGNAFTRAGANTRAQRRCLCTPWGEVMVGAVCNRDLRSPSAASQSLVRPKACRISWR